MLGLVPRLVERVYRWSGRPGSSVKYSNQRSRWPRPWLRRPATGLRPAAHPPHRHLSAAVWFLPDRPSSSFPTSSLSHTHDRRCHSPRRRLRPRVLGCSPATSAVAAQARIAVTSGASRLRRSLTLCGGGALRRGPSKQPRPSSDDRAELRE